MGNKQCTNDDRAVEVSEIEFPEGQPNDLRKSTVSPEDRNRAPFSTALSHYGRRGAQDIVAADHFPSILWDHTLYSMPSHKTCSHVYFIQHENRLHVVLIEPRDNVLTLQDALQALIWSVMQDPVYSGPLLAAICQSRRTPTPLPPAPSSPTSPTSVDMMSYDSDSAASEGNKERHLIRKRKRAACQKRMEELAAQLRDSQTRLQQLQSMQQVVGS